ncbi:MAG: DNA replication/repair protein RecF [Chlorobi bacterium]|nr:DNA replication/repair protein RecF [Chlorobiota bacterium]
MNLKNISLINFKNYEQLEVSFSSRINGFIGNNGVGKTNLLDAIYYLSFCKSYFNAVDSQNIKHNESFLVIQGNYNISNHDEAIYCGIKKNKKKQFKRNKKEYEKLADHIGLIPLVMISPADSNLITAGSEERRRFLNVVISQYDKGYLNDLIKYNKAVNQRNKLLKDFAYSNNYDEEMLLLWDAQMIVPGENILAKRLDFIERLIPIFQKYYNYISSGLEEVQLEYQTTVINNSFKEALLKSRQKDRALQYSTVGIHKDDLSLKLRNYPIRKIGSQGQQKTFLLALKLAQFDFLKELYGFKPILLFDDIFDKLDSNRVEKIVELVADNNFGQIFITDTGKERLKNILKHSKIDYQLFNIEDGNVLKA